KSPHRLHVTGTSGRPTVNFKTPAFISPLAPTMSSICPTSNERKRVEMRFAHLKTHHGFERLRLRGLSGARDEFHLAAIVQNLKTMALRLVWPPPDLAAVSVA